MPFLAVYLTENDPTEICRGNVQLDSRTDGYRHGGSE